MIINTDNTVGKNLINNATIVEVIIMRVEIAKESQINHISKRKLAAAQIADKNLKRKAMAENKKNVTQELTNILTANNLQKTEAIKEDINWKKVTKNIKGDIAVPNLPIIKNECDRSMYA